MSRDRGPLATSNLNCSDATIEGDFGHIGKKTSVVSHSSLLSATGALHFEAVSIMPMMQFIGISTRYAGDTQIRTTLTGTTT
jgi:hypothetical protein